MAKEKGTLSSDKGTYIPVDKRAPYAPENKHLSKAEFIEAQKKRKEKELRLRELASEIDKEQGIEKPKEEKKRPKKIE